MPVFTSHTIQHLATVRRTTFRAVQMVGPWLFPHMGPRYLCYCLWYYAVSKYFCGEEGRWSCNCEGQGLKTCREKWMFLWYYTFWNIPYKLEYKPTFFSTFFMLQIIRLTSHPLIQRFMHLCTHSYTLDKSYLNCPFCHIGEAVLGIVAQWQNSLIVSKYWTYNTKKVLY